MVLNYDYCLAFYTTLGHNVESFENVGFISSFTQGTECAAMGKVTFHQMKKPVVESSF